MAILSPHLSVGTINIKGLHSLLKRHRMPVWIKKQEANICCLQETHLSPKDKHRLKVKGRKMMLQVNGSQKKMDVAILISNKTDFKPKMGDKTQRSTIYNIKGAIYQE